MRLTNIAIVAIAAPLSLIAALPLVFGLRETRALVPAELTPDEARKAVMNLSPEARAQLEKREMARLRQEPLELSALSNLALISSLAQKYDRTIAYSLEAASRSLRDPGTQLVAIAEYLKREDYSQAFRHADGLLATNPPLSEQVYPLLLGTLSDNKGLQNLAATLAARPYWRADFINWLGKKDSSGQIVFSLFDAIKKSDGAVTDSEIRLLVTQQIEQKKYDSAYFYWLDSLSPTKLAKTGNLFDGQFQFEPSNQYFDWNTYSTANVMISVEPDQAASGSRILHVNFINNVDPFSGVFQFLHLAPGPYMMGGQWSASNLVTTTGLVWKIECLNSGVAIGQSGPFDKADSRSEFKFSFNVPDKDCDFQNVRLTNASPAVLDAKISGELSFTELSISEKG